MQQKCSSLEVLVLQSWNRRSFCWLEGWDDFCGPVGVVVFVGSNS